MAQSGISQEELKGLKLLAMVCKDLTESLKDVYRWGTDPESQTLNLFEYLDHMGKHMNDDERFEYFRKLQENTIKEGPSCDMFDLSLLFQAIKVACKDVAPSTDYKWNWNNKGSDMETFIARAMSFRNSVFHRGQLKSFESRLKRKKDELKKLITNIYKTAGKKYKKSDTVVNDKITLAIRNIEEIYSQEFLDKRYILRICGVEMKQRLIQDSQEKLEAKFTSVKIINPFFNRNFDIAIHIQDVFVELMLETSENQQRTTLHYWNILPLARQQPGPSRPQLLLLVGLAGSGKTTMITKYIAEWTEGGHGSIKGFDQYDLLLPIQCRDTHVETFQGLLQNLIPTISYRYREHFMELIYMCNILLLIDGLDELNEHSSKLLADVMRNLKSHPQSTLLCTSRPLNIEDYLGSDLQDFSVTKINIVGIKEENRIKFLVQYHEKLQQKINTGKQSKRLVRLMGKAVTQQELYRLPVHLKDLVLLYNRDSDGLTADTTQTELLQKIHDFRYTDLKQKLADREQTRHRDKRKLNCQILKVLLEMYKAALLGLSRNELVLSPEAVEQVSETCDKEDLPNEVLLSSYFCRKPVQSRVRPKEQYTVPHKSLQDFYAALCVVETVKNSRSSAKSGSTACQSPSVSLRSVLQQTIKTDTLDLGKYINVLVHVAGLLHLQFKSVPDDLAREVVQLLSKAGMREKLWEDEWLDILENCKAAPATVREISKNIKTGRTIKIRDNRVRSWAALLPHIGPSETGVLLQGDPRDLPQLQDLLTNLRRHKTYLNIIITNENMNSWKDFMPYIKDANVRIDVKEEVTDTSSLEELFTNLPHTCNRVTVYTKINNSNIESRAASLPCIQQANVRVTVNSKINDTTHLTDLFTNLPCNNNRVRVLTYVNSDNVQSRIDTLPHLQQSEVEVLLAAGVTERHKLKALITSLAHKKSTLHILLNDTNADVWESLVSHLEETRVQVRLRDDKTVINDDEKKEFVYIEKEDIDDEEDPDNKPTELLMQRYFHVPHETSTIDRILYQVLPQ